MDRPVDLPRVEALRVKNYRALRDVRLDDLTPLTVLIGPNGSGKSTVLDVFAFISECFTCGLREALGRRGRFKELRSRGSDGSIVIELRYRERPGAPLIVYHVEVDEGHRGPVVKREFLCLDRAGPGASSCVMDYRLGKGWVAADGRPGAGCERVEMPLSGSDVLAANVLGQLGSSRLVTALRDFVTSWRLFSLSTDAARGCADVGVEEQFSAAGDDLPNAIKHLAEEHPERLERVLEALRRRVPHVEGVDFKPLCGGGLLLQVRDALFSSPVSARFASDGVLKMLAYLVMLYGSRPPMFIGIDGPESHMHHRLLPELAEDFDLASGRAQLVVATHSPLFIDRLRLEQVRVLCRAADGYARARRVADMPGIQEFLDEGASLGELWMEGHFEA